jgi:glutamyl-tRNA reductase
MMRGVQKLTFINRTYPHAADLAERNQSKVAGWHQLAEMLESVDMVVTATGAPHTVLHTTEIAPLLPARTRPSLLIMDIAVPRDVEESVGDLPGVKLFDIDDLLAALDENLAQRQAQVPLVEAIIAEEQRSFVDWMHTREVVPLISDLHRQAVTLVDAELERALRKLGQLSREETEIVRQLGYRIASKLLHEPTVRLKAAAADGRGISYADAIRELFALEAHNATPDGLLNNSHNDGSVVSGD